MIGNILAVLWLSIPIWIILFLNKKIRGYYWYGKKRCNLFWEEYSTFNTFKLNHVKVNFTKPTGFAIYNADILINQIGIYIRHSSLRTKKNGVLIFFNHEELEKYNPPSYALFKSYEIKGQSLVIKGESTKELFNSSFKLKFKKIPSTKIDQLEKCLLQNISEVNS